MASESTVQRRVWLALGRWMTLFRTNSGKAWLSGGGKVQRLVDGSVVVPAARPVALGLGLMNGDPVVGQSDLQGWTPIVITPAMVGKTLPIYTAIETKNSKGGTKTDHQMNFVDQVRRDGGIAGFANSPEAAQRILTDWQAQFREPAQA